MNLKNINIKKRTYDLEDRTQIFANKVIMYCRTIQTTNISSILIGQLIRSATSIGANYCEANGASSKKDFKNKIYLCKKESKETKYWLYLLIQHYPDKNKIDQCLWNEAQELTLIFSKIICNTY